MRYTPVVKSSRHFQFNSDALKISSIYGDTAEQMKHRRYMEVVAAELNRPLHAIVPVYEHTLVTLRSRARITDYLPILVFKRVKEYFKS